MNDALTRYETSDHGIANLLSDLASLTSTASYVLDSEAYVKHGAFNDHSKTWGDTFRALGGETCVIEPSWRYGQPVGDFYMTVVGTPEALAYVENTVAA